ncbi:hypothetical protein G3A56_02520 [Rhizobium oryzihabitans]|uniref:Uncharacterized protein n=1 Tax=Rhizobium oryzihabitans TaxID=2267833 RepID=A0A7L5BDU7_9HYPH|nr:hypothetical protein [Rhizobium oryzihabitans]QIB37006.1 hypothetical protein G3A56_02520 [Rhizobium oryzihabitans]
MSDNLSREQLTALCMAKLEEIGKTSGRLLFQKAVMFDLPLHALEEEIEAAVKDVQDHLTDGGTCDNDIQIACNTFKLALLREGRRLVSLIPDEGGSVQ